MTDTRQNDETELVKLLECPICMSAFTDPRMLPCIHTFCFKCLKSTAEANQLKSGDKMPCPLCRNDFTIPADGVNGVPRNFFMENLLQFKSTLQMGSVSVICDTCNASNEGKTGEIPKATMRCLDCQDNYCDSCGKAHQFQRLSRNHKVEQIISGNEASRMTQFVTVKYCTNHPQKHLEYFCADCKKIVCVSCFVESHSSHKCKDVTTLDKEYRKTIEEKAWKISSLKNEISSLRDDQEKRKSEFLIEIERKEKEILKRNQEVKRMIDQHTQSLVNELFAIKSNHLKEMETQMEEIDRCCTILKSFESYCTELRLKGSAVDICSSVDQLIVRADELERDHEAFIGRPYQSVELSFQATDLADVLRNSNGNLVGNIKGTTAQLQNFAVVVGFNDLVTLTKDVVKINLCQPHEISSVEQIPTTMKRGSFAAVYCNTIYVLGVGVKNDEIWKYSVASGWLKCASLIQGRRRHSAAFVDEVLYICGGFVDSDESVLDSVEAYNAVADKCTAVGKLVHCVMSSGNCVPFKSSIYIFGGTNQDDKAMNHVQVYNTQENTCSVLSAPMPRPYNLMRAVLWETYVILLGYHTCFIFNLETETWQEREQFKTDVVHFGLVLENDRIFVIGGGFYETDANDDDDHDDDHVDDDDGDYEDVDADDDDDDNNNNNGNLTWKFRDDVRYVPLQNIIDNKAIEWKIHATSPKPSLVQAFAKIRFPV